MVAPGSADMVYFSGGIPDCTAAAKSILHDWNTLVVSSRISIICVWCSGRITFYTHPPEQHTAHVSAEIVKEWSTAFDLVRTVQQLKLFVTFYSGLTTTRREANSKWLVQYRLWDYFNSKCCNRVGGWLKPSDDGSRAFSNSSNF